MDSECYFGMYYYWLDYAKDICGTKRKKLSNGIKKIIFPKQYLAAVLKGTG